MAQLNLFNNHSNSWTKNIIFYGFIILFTLLLTPSFLRRYLSPYVFQEWLINYSHGFVRRGLFGTFFLFLHDHYNISITSIFKIIFLFSYAILVLFSSIYLFKVRQCKKNLNLESLAFLLFSPSLLPFIFNNSSIVGRKEFLIFLGLLINLFLLEKYLKIFKFNSDPPSDETPQTLAETVNKYCYSLFIGYNLLSIPTALSHEAILFLGLPINLIITANVIALIFPVKKALVRTVLIYLPTLIASFLCLIFKGNETIALGICQSWQNYQNQRWDLDCSNVNTIPGVLIFLNVSLKEVIKIVFNKNVLGRQDSAFLSWIFVFSLNIVILMRVSLSLIKSFVEDFKRKFPDQPESNFAPVNIFTIFTFKYAFIPFICSLIMYVIAIDWGRWFFIVFVNYTLCLLSPILICLEIMNYSRNTKILGVLYPLYLWYSKVLTYFTNKSLVKHFYPIYFLIFIYTLLGTKIVHLGMNYQNLFKGSLYTVYKTLKF